MAQMACLSIPQFCRSFKKHFDIAPAEYLMRLRMDYASYLLDDVNLSIGQIGAMVGYDNVYYFSKMFKKYYGKSPSKMRKP